MKINKKVIQKLKPCQNRFENYVTHYGNKDFTAKQFMGLKKITHEDKLWVAFRLMGKKNIRLAAADIAETVLHIYEKKYPGDDRPRKAIEVARSGKGTNAAAAAYSAAYSAAAAAYSAAYSAAAAAAAYSAANAATYATYAAYSAANAANAATYAAYKKMDQEKLVRKICLKYLK